MKILPVGAELFCVDRETKGWTDGLYKANRCFPQFCEHALKEVILVWKHCETLCYSSVYIINNYILSKLDILVSL